MDIDIPIDDEVIVIVDVVEQLVPSEDFASVSDESAQDPKFREGQLNGFVPFAEHIPFDIEAKFVEFHHFGRFYRFIATAQNRFDAREEDFWRKWFLDIIISAKLEPQYDIEFISFGREDDDRNSF